MSKTEEKQLIKKCLRQDRLAQRMLYEKYKAAMYTCALRITNDQVLAQDALQEAFIKVFKNLASFRGQSTLGSWIKTIVVRTALKEVRGLHLHVDIAEYGMGARVSFDDTLTGPLLHELVKSLPDKCRVVFSLVEIEGFAHKEVAQMLGVKEGTSKSQLYYAKQMLKKKLELRGYEQRKRG